MKSYNISSVMKCNILPFHEPIFFSTELGPSLAVRPRGLRSWPLELRVRVEDVVDGRLDVVVDQLRCALAADLQIERLRENSGVTLRVFAARKVKCKT